MTAIRTSQQNSFEGTLTAEMGPNDLTATVDGIGTLTSPCYLVIEMDSDTQREYIYFDGTFTATSFVTSNISKRYLAGSAAGSNLTHPIGTKIRTYVGKQHHDDIHDRIDGIDHSTLGGLSADDHPQYALVDGTRAFTGAVGGISPVAGTDLATKTYVDGQVAGGVPPGIIMPYGAAVAPGGYLLCDGAEVSRATYNDLFLVIGTNYGVGDGSTTFDLPDLQGRFPLGLATVGTGSALGDVGGTLDPTIDLSHAHTVDSHTHDIGHGHADTIAYASGGAHTHTMPTHTHSIAHNHGAFTSAGGSPHSHSGPSHTHDVSDTSGGPSSTTWVNDDAGTLAQVPTSTHTHYISDTSTSGGTGSTGTDSTHTHSIDVPNFTGNSGATDPGDTNSGGAHTHTKSGGVTSHVGNSGAASPGTDTVGSATAAVPNAPFLAVQFIIKT